MTWISSFEGVTLDNLLVFGQVVSSVVGNFRSHVVMATEGSEVLSVSAKGDMNVRGSLHAGIFSFFRRMSSTTSFFL